MLEVFLFYFVLFLIALLAFDAYRVLTDPCRLPGPYGLPFIGYLPFLGERNYLTLSTLAKKYGAIYQLRIGPQKMVVLNDLDTIKEAFGSHDFSDRPKVRSFRLFNDIFGPIASLGFNPDSAVMRYTRRLAIKSIGTMVHSKSSRVESLTSGAVDYTLDSMNRGEKNALEICRMAVGTVIGSLSFGHVFDATSATLPKIYALANTLSEYLSLSNISDYIPFIATIFPAKDNEFRDGFVMVRDFINEQIDGHQLKSSSEIHDIQDAIEYLYGETKEDMLDQLNVSLKEVKRLGQSLFGAGFATTSEHYAMALLLLTTYPDIQEKVYQDIKGVLGDQEVKDEVSLDDRNRMPYTQAFLMELFRYFSHVPLSLPHYTTTDVVFRGYHIPRGTMVMSNLWNVHHNIDVFGPDVYTFNPDRFLDETTIDQRTKHVVPFGVGRRKCVGELLARRELFLLIAKSVQKAKIELVSFEGIDPSDTIVGFTLNTKPAKIQMISR